MTTTNDSLKLAELLKTPICKMDGEELAFLITSITSNQQAQMLLTQPKQEEHNVYGIAGIAQIFGCSIPTASRIKKSGIIEDNTIASQKEIIERDKNLIDYLQGHIGFLEDYIKEIKSTKTKK